MPTTRGKKTRGKPSAGGKDAPHGRKTAPPGAAGPAGTTTVRVRMYRQGLGDCFLLTFDPGGSEKHILIDCGSLGATTTGVKLPDVVADIATTVNHHLDLVIATHEHWDHVAAFRNCQNDFKKPNLTVDHVWLAWTEDPQDPLAQQLAKNKEDIGTALAAASRALTAPQAAPDSKAAGAAVKDLLGFFGDDLLGASGGVSEKLNDAMKFVRTGFTTKPEYHNPGDGPIETAWLPGFRFYILGPPRDKKALYDMGEHGSSELYGIAAGLRAAATFHLSGKTAVQFAAATGPGDDGGDFQHELPFDNRFRRELDDPEIQEQFRQSYFANSNKWRRADEDWLHVASELALQMDSATNNTSLAFALERISDGKVLLFPADAQQGNWLSWYGDKMEWTVKENGGTRPVTATDLLNKTVFYKVGHHSSHNATAKAKGLELMLQEGELTAFIPVDRAVALKKSPQGSWRMPARDLYRRLLEKCQGRVVRSDLGWAADAQEATDKAVEKEFVGMATAAEWTKWGQAQKAAKNVQINALSIDYTLN